MLPINSSKPHKISRTLEKNRPNHNTNIQQLRMSQTNIHNQFSCAQTSLTSLPPANLSKSAVLQTNKQNTRNSYLSQIQQDFLKTIITQNAKYYQDKTKVCCSSKPTKHRLVMPSSTGNTIYRQDFIPKDGLNSTSQLKFKEYKSKSPFMNTTNYNDSFVPHQIQLKKKNVEEFEKIEDAPRFLQSQYKGDYKNWEVKEGSYKIEHPQNYLLGIGEMAKRSVYGMDFTPKDQNRLDNCKFPDSAIFTDWKIPKNSHYQQQFTQKPGYGNNNYKMKNRYLPTVGLPNYNSEYKSEFDKKKKKGCSYKKILTAGQLQDLILSL